MAPELRKPLSPREQEVVELLVEELLTAEIAQILMISPNTVNAHIQRIALKLPPGDGSPIRRIRKWRRLKDRQQVNKEAGGS